jgi:hypothetical protein
MGGIFVGPGVLVHADLGFAEGLPQLAARVESAPRRPGFGTRGLTGDRVERLGWFAAERQQTREQAAGVGMLRVGEHVGDRSRFHDATRVHHEHAIADLRDRREIVLTTMLVPP